MPIIEQRSIATIDPLNVSIDFSTSNSDVIREIAASRTYGNTDENVVLTAISLLYMIFKTTKTCESFTIHDKDGNSYIINMPKLG